MLFLIFIYEFSICFWCTYPYRSILIKALYIIDKISGLNYVQYLRRKSKRQAAFLVIPRMRSHDESEFVSFPQNLDV